jgi:hypothetical protein
MMTGADTEAMISEDICKTFFQLTEDPKSDQSSQSRNQQMHPPCRQVKGSRLKQKASKRFSQQQAELNWKIFSDLDTQDELEMLNLAVFMKTLIDTVPTTTTDHNEDAHRGSVDISSHHPCHHHHHFYMYHINSHIICLIFTQ